MFAVTTTRIFRIVSEAWRDFLSPMQKLSVPPTLSGQVPRYCNLYQFKIVDADHDMVGVINASEPLRPCARVMFYPVVDGEIQATGSLTTRGSLKNTGIAVETQLVRSTTRVA
ncbi:hypothetical protein KC573_02270 [candidate division WWE3 bacterium]|uniref:Uncharacterized protein n=1 Tax=candidate division WWE3 bacterium TaxID=2053526 RepID=A0A955RWA2_UNCKA|nr:hypothetical protein [candidate division WWE3 bacterium]